MSGELRYETATGAALRPRLPAVARLRAAVFREWPYLYEAGPGDEEEYLGHYAADPGAAVVLAFAGDEVVGAATCQPMAATHGAVPRAFREAGLDPARWCYFGESVLLRAHRGRGAGRVFFARREAHARALGLRACCFCAVVRNPNDPRRPADHEPLDAFWSRLGYVHHPEISCVFEWAEPGDGGRDTPHALSFWLKDPV
jgi:GNAT superfamily N-acetyltransferase